MDFSDLPLPDYGQAHSALIEIAENTPLGSKGLAAGIGVLLLGWGAKIYRLAIAAPGALLGLALVGELPVRMDEQTLLIVSVIAAVVGAGLTLSIEKVAIRVAGAILCAPLAEGLWPLFQKGNSPDWLPLAGAVVGALLFPLFWKQALKVVTPAIGAVAIAFALERPQHLPMIAALTLLGSIYQLSQGKSGDRDS